MSRFRRETEAQKGSGLRPLPVGTQQQADPGLLLGPLSPAAPPRPRQDLGTPDADDSVDIAGGIVEVGDSERVLASGDPVPLGGWVNLEHMCPCAEDGLLPAWGEGSQWGLGTTRSSGPSR